jgi:hypothetical protein
MQNESNNYSPKGETTRHADPAARAKEPVNLTPAQVDAVDDFFSNFDYETVEDYIDQMYWSAIVDPTYSGDTASAGYYFVMQLKKMARKFYNNSKP